MALFKEEHYGKLISTDLANYLRSYTDIMDRAKVSSVTGVGISTIRDVVYQRNTLTENSSAAIIELMKIAVQNCKNSITKAKKVKNELEIMLETE